MAKRILIIPDLHGRTFWKDAVKQEINNVDKIVFLGDYLDPYGWEGISKTDAIDNFVEVINFKKENPDKVILLLANHDMPYIDKKHFTTRVRYDMMHAGDIGHLFKSNSDLFQLAYENVINGVNYLFTHSGLIYEWYHYHKDLIGELTVDNLNNLLNSAEGVSALCFVSRYRGGWNKYPSILWGDIHEFGEIIQAGEKINGNIPWDYQIFGHTMVNKPIIEKEFACLDCKKAFILNEDGSIREVEKNLGTE